MLLEIVNDILDFSKVEAGKLKLESIEFNLEHITEKGSLRFFAAALSIRRLIFIWSSVKILRYYS